jgi:hypothetical protein
MLISRLLPLFVAVSFLLPTSASSEMQEIREYTVKRGDTLWDISESELQDPFLWPKIWKENTYIKNPDRIYPDQVVKIPLYLIQPVSEPVAEQVIQPEIKEVAEIKPVKMDPIVSKNVYLASGYIVEALEGAGRINGSPGGRNLFGNNDLVYVNTKDNVNIGDKFFIVRKGQDVVHPVTRVQMGHIVDIVGVAEISKFQYGETLAKILISFKEVITGDILDTYSDVNPPVMAKPFRQPEVDAYVVAAHNLRIMNTDYDIVHIDRGLDDGLHPGDLLRTVAVGRHKVPNGIIQIIKPNTNTSTAIVVSSTDPVIVGNWVTRNGE